MQGRHAILGLGGQLSVCWHVSSQPAEQDQAHPPAHAQALELAEAGTIQSFAGTNVTVTMDPESRDFYATIRLTDGRELFYRILDYPVHEGKQ